jgi:hypothetical protein
MSASSTAEPAAETTATGSKPVFTHRSGNVRGSVFRDDLDRKDGSGTFSRYRTSIQKFYKPRDGGDWEYTSSFDEDELFDVHLVSAEAYKFIKSDRANNTK